MENEGTVEPAAEPVVTPEPEVKPDPPKEPAKVYAQEEVDKIVNKAKKNAAYRAKKETEAYYRGLEQGRQPPPKPPQDTTPKRENFESYEEYVKEEARHIARKEASEVLSKEREQATSRQRADAEAKTAQDFQTKLYERFPDIDKKIEDIGDLELPPGVGNAIATSEFGPEIVNYLADNIKDAERISKLSPSAAIREIGRLEVKFEAKPPVKPSSAPAPIKPVVPSGPGDINAMPDPKADPEKWIEWRNAQIRANKR